MEVLEPNHTHYLLLDNGQMFAYLGDGQRAKFVDEATKDGDCKWMHACCQNHL